MDYLLKPPIVWNTPIVWNIFLFDGPYCKLWWSNVLYPWTLVMGRALKVELELGPNLPRSF